MSQNDNNATSAIAMGVAVVGAVCMIFFVLIYAALLFLALVLTFLCLFAWERDISLGRWALSSGEARTFIYRGLAGAVAVPAFALFCAALFGIRVDPDLWIHLVLGGYALGSVGVAMLENSDAAEADHEASRTIEHTRLPPPAHAEPPKGFIPPQPSQARPFRFASWDDEEERS